MESDYDYWWQSTLIKTKYIKAVVIALRMRHVIAY